MASSCDKNRNLRDHKRTGNLCTLTRRMLESKKQIGPVALVTHSLANAVVSH